MTRRRLVSSTQHTYVPMARNTGRLGELEVFGDSGAAAGKERKCLRTN